MAVASHSAASSVEEAAPTESRVRQAAAYRAKYRVSEVLLRIPISQVGFHPSNRDGQAVSGLRCESLLQDILQVGFDEAEANAGGVVVQANLSEDKICKFNYNACIAAS